MSNFDTPFNEWEEPVKQTLRGLYLSGIGTGILTAIMKQNPDSDPDSAARQAMDVVNEMVQSEFYRWQIDQVIGFNLTHTPMQDMHEMPPESPRAGEFYIEMPSPN